MGSCMARASFRGDARGGLGVTEPSLKLVTESGTRSAEGSARAIFHSVNSLVPEQQDLVDVAPETSVREAVELMEQHDFRSCRWWPAPRYSACSRIAL